jgi:hypothetical protein
MFIVVSRYARPWRVIKKPEAALPASISVQKPSLFPAEHELTQPSMAFTRRRTGAGRPPRASIAAQGLVFLPPRHPLEDLFDPLQQGFQHGA